MKTEKLILALSQNGGKGEVFAGGNYLCGKKLLSVHSEEINLGNFKSTNFFKNGWFSLIKSLGTFLYDDFGEKRLEQEKVSFIRSFANGWYFIKSGRHGFLNQKDGTPLYTLLRDADVFDNGWYAVKNTTMWRLFRQDGSLVAEDLTFAQVLKNEWYLLKYPEVCTLYEANGRVIASAKIILANDSYYAVKVRGGWIVYDMEDEILAHGARSVKLIGRNACEIVNGNKRFVLGAHGKILKQGVLQVFDNDWYTILGEDAKQYLVLSHRDEMLEYSGVIEVTKIDDFCCALKTGDATFVLRNKASIDALISDVLSLTATQPRISQMQAEYFNKNLNFLGCKDYAIEAKS